MKLYKSEQARQADSYAINQIGLSSAVLMEHASRGVFEEISNRFPNTHLHNFMILYGTGNNGGDALCIARMLILSGCKVNLVRTLGEPKTPDGRLQMESLLKTAQSEDYLRQIESKDVFKNIDDNTVVIDGVFGIGFRADVSNPLDKGLVKLFEDVRKANYIISIDVPSGIDADTGEVAQGSIKADCTVTFIYPKVGLFISPASLHAGDIVVKQLFSPLKPVNTDYELVDEHLARDLIAPLKRKPNAHKGTYGHIAILSPEKGMEGAVAMSVMASLRSGAGLVTVVAIDETKESLRHRMPMLAPEAMISTANTSSMKTDDFKKFNSLIVGPGFGKRRSLELKKILEAVNVPLIIDADALNIIAEDPKLFELIKNKDAILTPHPGEMARLFPQFKDVQNHRLKSLEGYVKGHQFCLLLKGYRSMLGRGDGGVFINYTGNPALSKGGSGDVLSGVIGAFAAQGLEPWKAGVLGMYIHGLCADRLVLDDKNSDFGILPTDIINELGNVIRCLTE